MYDVYQIVSRGVSEGAPVFYHSDFDYLYRSRDRAFRVALNRTIEFVKEHNGLGYDVADNRQITIFNTNNHYILYVLVLGGQDIIDEEEV